MTDTPTQVWDRHRILAEIKRRFGSLTAFAATTPLPKSHFSVALGTPYPKADRLIANALGENIHQVWPDRYNKDGSRKASPSRQLRYKASPPTASSANPASARSTRANRDLALDIAGRR